MKDLFFSLECLTEISKPLTALSLKKKWFKHSDKRYLSVTLQKLIDYNKDQFEYLGITPILEGSDNSLQLSFRSDKFIGAISIKSSETGKPIGDLLVFPRFSSSKDKFTEYTELLKTVGIEIHPEINDKYELQSSLDYSFPQYYEAVKFINLLLELTSRPWKKFKEQKTTSPYFKGNVNWEKHIANSYKVEQNSKIPTSFSQLSSNHNDYCNIKFAFSVAKSQIFVSTTPISIRNSIENKVKQIEIRLAEIDEKATSKLKSNRSDFSLVKQTKDQGNIVLNANSLLRKSWRIDYSVVFERTIQHLFTQIGKEIGGRVSANAMIKNISSNKSPWSLNHLEPDIILEKNDQIIFIDAKYKSHLFNRQSNSPFLKDEHRKDIHQILAYSSFNKDPNKLAFLCYPSSTLSVVHELFYSPKNNTKTSCYLIGVPLDHTLLTTTKDRIKKIICEYLG